jgi:hypothetical protein
MKKYIAMLVLAAFVTAGVIGCGEAPKPAAKPAEKKEEKK